MTRKVEHIPTFSPRYALKWETKYMVVELGEAPGIWKVRAYCKDGKQIQRTLKRLRRQFPGHRFDWTFCNLDKVRAEYKPLSRDPYA